MWPFHGEEADGERNEPSAVLPKLLMLSSFDSSGMPLPLIRKNPRRSGQVCTSEPSGSKLKKDS